MGRGFDIIRFCSCANLWPRRGREMHAAGGAWGWEVRREVYLSWQRFRFLFTFLLFGPTAFGRNSKQATSLRLWKSKILEYGLTTAFLIALVKAVGESVALPPSWDTLPIRTHEVSRNVALCGDVVAWQQLAFWWRRRKHIITNFISRQVSSPLRNNI